MELRTKMVHEILTGKDTVTDIAAKYGVSRTVAYKWRNRFLEQGPQGLVDRSRRPHSSPSRTPPAVEEAVCEARKEQPSWGGLKLHRVLSDDGLEGLPTDRTVDRILQRRGKTKPPPPPPPDEPLSFEHPSPNGLWQIDFKSTVYIRFSPSLIKAIPMSIIDDHSRFALALCALPNRPLDTIWPVFWEAMGQWGMPWAILTDNDGVFRGRRGGVSAWTARLWRLGIAHRSGRYYHPQTQGKVERFHGTIKTDVLDQTVLQSVDHLQVCLDQFRYTYNYERPHQALELDTPAAHYEPSSRERPDELPPVVYPEGATLRKVHQNGAINVRNCRINVGDGLRGQYVRLHEGDEILRIEYAGYTARRVAWDQLRKGRWI